MRRDNNASNSPGIIKDIGAVFCAVVTKSLVGVSVFVSTECFGQKAFDQILSSAIKVMILANTIAQIANTFPLSTAALSKENLATKPENGGMPDSDMAPAKNATAIRGSFFARLEISLKYPEPCR